MFDVPTTARRRPMFGVSAALHAALGIALVVPPLFATPEPAEPDGFVKISWGPSLTSYAPRIEKVDLLRRGNGGGASAPAARVSHVAAPVRPSVTQPPRISELLPAPTGELSESPFEESSGEHREPGMAGGFGTGGAGDDGDGGTCEDCKIISATAPGVSPPVPLETVSPVYPEPARRAHVEGVVVLEAIIGADGLVRDVRILRGASPLLDPAALDAVRRWRYRPARIGERPVAVYLKVVLTYSLRNL